MEVKIGLIFVQPEEGQMKIKVEKIYYLIFSWRVKTYQNLPRVRTFSRWIWLFNRISCFTPPSSPYVVICREWSGKMMDLLFSGMKASRRIYIFGPWTQISDHIFNLSLIPSCKYSRGKKEEKLKFFFISNTSIFEKVMKIRKWVQSTYIMSIAYNIVLLGVTPSWERRFQLFFEVPFIKFWIPRELE